MHLSLAEIKAFADERGGKIVKYYEFIQNCTFSCKNNHMWNASFSEISEGKWCYYCKRYDDALAEVKEIINAKNGKLHTLKFTRKGTILSIECEFGHKWNASEYHLQRGEWCFVCKEIEKTKEEKLMISSIKKIVKQKKGKLLAFKPLHKYFYASLDCGNGHKFSLRSDELLNGKWCSACEDIEKDRKEKKLIVTYLKKYGYKIVTENFFTANTRVLMECPADHPPSLISFNNFRKGSRCKLCKPPNPLALLPKGNPKLKNKTKLSKTVTIGKEATKLHKTLLTKNILVEFTCSEGHKWMDSPQNVKNGSWCKKCETQKLTYEDRVMYEKIAESMGGKLISDLFLDKNLKWECSLGHQWLATGASIKKGNWCLECQKNKQIDSKRMPITEMLAHIATEKGGKLLEMATNNSTPVELVCAENHHWSDLPPNVKAGKWCPICSQSAMLTQGLGPLQKIAQKHGGKLLSNVFLTPYTKMEWECTKGYKFTATAQQVKQGEWCKKCPHEAFKTLTEQFQELAKKKGGRLISSKINNLESGVIWECSQGHKWNTSPYNVKAGRWCMYCQNAKSRGR